MPDYEAMRVEHPKMKARLTRARKRGPVAVLETCAETFQRFAEIGFPDDWHTWNIAAYDAETELRFSRRELDESDVERANQALRIMEVYRF